MVLDYSIDCGFCSRPMKGPARDGASAVCAYLHTRGGRRQFEATLKRNRATKSVADSAQTVAPSPNEAIIPSPTPDATPNQSNDATVGHTNATLDTLETRSQRHRRLKRERNGLST